MIIIFNVTGVPNSRNFDLQLMIYLIKYLTSTNSKNRIYHLPSAEERTTRSDLVTLQWYRQNLFHDNSYKLYTVDFNETWNNIAGVSIF